MSSGALGMGGGGTLARGDSGFGAADAEATRGAAGGVLGLAEDGTPLLIALPDDGALLGFAGTALGRFERGGGPLGFAGGAPVIAGLLPMSGRMGGAPLRATAGAIGGFAGATLAVAGFAGGFGGAAGAELAAFGTVGLAGAPGSRSRARGCTASVTSAPLGGITFGCVRDPGATEGGPGDATGGGFTEGELPRFRALEGTGGGANLGGATEAAARGGVL